MMLVNFDARRDMENHRWIPLQQAAFICRYLVSIAMIVCGAFNAKTAVAQTLSSAPVAPVRTVTEDYFGTKVADPYRYMENLSDPNVKQWFKDQDAYTRSVLSQISGRNALLARLRQLNQSGPPRVFDLQRYNDGRYFYEKRLPKEDVAKLYERIGLQGAEKLILDPDQYATNPGEHETLSYYTPSFDGHYIAFGVSPSGSEDAVIHVLDLTNGKETGESIDRSWYGGISWLPDGRSFLHIRLQKLAPGVDPAQRRLKSRVYLHIVGTDPDSDLPIFGFGVNAGIALEPEDGCGVLSDPRIPYALAIVNHGFSNDQTIYSAPIESIGKADVKWQKIIDTEDGVVNLDFHGDDLYLVTHKDAPRFKVVRTSLSHPDLNTAQVVIPAGEAVVTNISAMEDALYIQELDGGIGRLLRLPYSTSETQEISMPFDGNIVLDGGDSRLDGVLFDLSAWTRAPKIYEYSANKKAVEDTKLQPLGEFDEPSDIESIEIKVPSHDGTMIPLSLIFKKGIALDGSHPTLLSGYGAYSITIDPYFTPLWIAWIEQGGVLAFAHVRGGGEYGEEWHQGGMMQNKPNTWRDFIACAEFLVRSRYTSPTRLAGEGGSAGGILIGRAITERPDLFAAALDDVGLSDMIRDMFSPDGPLNVPEYGDLKTKQGFESLYEISAYYHVKDGVHYPATMITTGMNDPRVVPWEPGKMAARMEAATNGKPVLLRVDYHGGHGTIGGTRAQTEELLADQWSFLFWQFGLPGYQPTNPAAKAK
jgi:prolyl oligopeptidase